MTRYKHSVWGFQNKEKDSILKQVIAFSNGNALFLNIESVYISFILLSFVHFINFNYLITKFKHKAQLFTFSFCLFERNFVKEKVDYEFPQNWAIPEIRTSRLRASAMCEHLFLSEVSYLLSRMFKFLFCNFNFISLNTIQKFRQLYFPMQNWAILKNEMHSNYNSRKEVQRLFLHSSQHELIIFLLIIIGVLKLFSIFERAKRGCKFTNIKVPQTN